jgi:hypothetical protein
MRPRRLAAMALPLLALGASQLGHLVASELRHGPRTLAPDGAGVHWYFPTFAALALGAAGGALVAAALVVAAARALRAGPRRDAVGRPPVLELAALMLVLQLGIYTAQETLERAVLGAATPSAGELLLWGGLGQLPVALTGALGLSWLLARFEVAVEDLAAPALLRSLTWPPAAAPAARGPRPPALAVLLARAAGRALAKRAPPTGAPRVPAFAAG